MAHGKVQICCLGIVFYIVFCYYRGNTAAKRQHKNNVFDLLLWVIAVTLVFDGITEYTVNRLDYVPDRLNDILHMFFLLGIDASIFTVFLYMLKITESYPQKKFGKFML